MHTKFNTQPNMASFDIDILDTSGISCVAVHTVATAGKWRMTCEQESQFSYTFKHLHTNTYNSKQDELCYIVNLLFADGSISIQHAMNYISVYKSVYYNIVSAN